MSSLVVSIVAAVFAAPATIAAAWLFWVAPNSPAEDSARQAKYAEYVRSLEAWSSNQVAGAAPWAAPGSPAELYALARTKVIQAWETKLDPDANTRKIESMDGGVRSCSVLSETDCVHFTEFVSDELGRVQSYRINGIPIASLVLSPDGQKSNEDTGLRTELTAGFRHPDNDHARTYLAIAVKDISGGNLKIDYSSFRYRDSRNVEIEAVAAGYDEFAQAQRGLLYVTFPSTPGGWLSFKISTPEGTTSQLWISV